MNPKSSKLAQNIFHNARHRVDAEWGLEGAWLWWERKTDKEAMLAELRTLSGKKVNPGNSCRHVVKVSKDIKQSLKTWTPSESG